MKLAKAALAFLFAFLALWLLPTIAFATVPSTVILTGPTGQVASTDVTFTFRAAAGSDSSDPASFQCRLDSTSAAAWSTCASPVSYTGLAEGAHTFEVRTKNGAGDGSGSVDPTPAVANFTVVIPPNTTITSGPSGKTASADANFAFSSTEPGSFECRLDSGSWSACASPKSYSDLAQGSHTFEVRAVDVSGNVDPTPATATFSVDTVAPQTTIDSGPTGPTASAAATFTFSSSEAGTFECRLDSSSAAAWSSCASPKSYSGLAQGSHTFEVRAIDSVGNADASPASASFSVDTVSPETTIDSSPTGAISVAEAEMIFHSSEPGSFQCRVDSAAAVAWGDCASPSTLVGLSEGSHSFEVRAIDAVGNIDPSPAVATFSVDTVAPETTIDSSPTGTIDVAEAELAFSSSEEGTFECRLDSAADDAWTPCTSPLALTGLSEGDHTFEVRAIDAVGNTDATPAAASFAVDTIAPKTTIDSSPTGTISVAEATISFSSSDEAAGFECRLDSAAEDAWAPCASPLVLAELAEGTHSFEVRAIDAVGNRDPSPAVATFSVDTVAPETVIDVAPAPKVNVAEASFSFSAPGAAGFECRIDSSSDADWAPCTSPVVLTDLVQGTHSFEVRAIDSVGNADPSPAATLFFVDIPVNGARLAATPLSGKVKIKTPDIKRFRPLSEGETIPVGSLVDTSEGKVRLLSVDASGTQQQASFSRGIFRVTQKSGAGLVFLKLRGEISCDGDEEASASARSSGRRLWGSGKGKFRTAGSYGSATVRGTIWFTEDRCDGTFFKVASGVVKVRDFPRHKSIALPAGKSYLAESPR